MDRKKELKLQYMQMKPQMGVFMIRSNFSNKCYLEKTQDLKGTMNGNMFKLETGNHPNRELQKDWKEHGEENFTVKILEKLEYDEDESKTDYKEDLTLLYMIWEEKMIQEQMELYKK